MWFAKAQATPRQRREARDAHFRAARDQHEFSDAAPRWYGIRPRGAGATGRGAVRTWIGEHLGAHEVPALASRAYRAVNEYLLGSHGRPRFQGKGRMHSVEGTGPGSGLRWKDNIVVWGDLMPQTLIKSPRGRLIPPASAAGWAARSPAVGS